MEFPLCVSARLSVMLDSPWEALASFEQNRGNMGVPYRFSTRLSVMQGFWWGALASRLSTHPKNPYRGVAARRAE